MLSNKKLFRFALGACTICGWVAGVLHSGKVHVTIGTVSVFALAAVGASFAIGISGGTTSARVARLAQFLWYAMYTVLLSRLTSLYLDLRGWIIMPELLIPFVLSFLAMLPALKAGIFAHHLSCAGTSTAEGE